MRTKLLKAIHRQNTSTPPVWFMRQAGRYHQHYQGLRLKHSFETLCKEPKLACEVTMGPIEAFDFDAAILFSDILYPLEAMGMGLRFDPGPKFDFQVKTLKEVEALKSVERIGMMDFQAEALRLIRAALEPQKALIGFVGSPLTLYAYAVEGSHKQVSDAKLGFENGLFDAFIQRLTPLLLANMQLQAEAGAEVIAIFDSAAGTFQDSGGIPESVTENLHLLLRSFSTRCPNVPIIYYAKGVSYAYWKRLKEMPFACLGVDWHTPIDALLDQPPGQWAIQGNFSPESMLLDTVSFKKELDRYFEPIARLPAQKRQAWISGLGHGVLPQTPEAHVRLFIQTHRECFR